MKAIYKICLSIICLILTIVGLTFGNSVQAQNIIQTYKPIQSPNSVKNAEESTKDSSLRYHPDNGKNLTYQPHQIAQDESNLLKNAIVTSNENILAQTKDIKVSYNFALYDTTLVIQLLTAFEIDSIDNRIVFTFDVNKNYKVDPGDDKLYSYYLQNFCKGKLDGMCSLQSDAWINFPDTKKINICIPVAEIKHDQFISLRIESTYGYWPEGYSFSKPFEIQIPEGISKAYTVAGKDASEITKTSCLAGVIVSPSANSIFSESGIIWSKNEAVTLDNNLGKIINKNTTGEFSVKIDGLEANNQYFYRVYAIQNSIPIYGKLKSFQTKVDNSQFTSVNNNLIFSNSGENVIALVSSDDFNKWRMMPSSAMLKSITTPLFSKIKDDFDFIFLVANSNEMLPDNFTYGLNYRVSNKISGIGVDAFADSYYGSSGRLKSIMWLPTRDAFKTGPTLHEILHNWGNYLFDSRALVGDSASPSGLKESKYWGHWGVSSVGGQLGGFDKLTTNVEGEPNKYRGTMLEYSSFGQNANGGNGLPYSNLELYLMGLIPPEEVVPVKFFYKLSVKNKEEFFYEGKFYSDSVVTYDYTKIIAQAGGPRVPDYKNSQKEFKALVVLISATMPNADEIKELDKYTAWFGNQNNDNDTTLYNFFEATGGRATLVTDNILKSVKFPIAIAGTDQLVTKGSIVSLDGSASFDPNGSKLTYKWTAPSGISLSSTTVANPTFVAPEVMDGSVLAFSLVVSAGNIYSYPSVLNITVKSDLNTGIDLIPENSLRIYPNPGKGTVWIENDNLNRNWSLNIISMIGKIIASYTISSEINEIDVSKLKPGVYIFQFKNQDVRVIKKFLKR